MHVTFWPQKLMAQNVPDIAFLGVCERSAQVTDANQLLAHSILGLKQVVLSHIFPIPLKGFQFAFALYDPPNFVPAKVYIWSPTGKELMKFSMKMEQIDTPTNIADGQSEDLIKPIYAPVGFPTWMFVVPTTPPDVNVLAEKPGLYKVTLRRGKDDISIGCIGFAHVPAPPLTDDRIAAIRSSPHAAKIVRMSLACQNCNDGLRFYAGLEHNEKLKKDGWTWYSELPASFKCKCRRTEIDLGILRDNLHGLLGLTTERRLDISFTRLYEQSVLEVTCNRFEALLNQKPDEESVQKFIKDNPILLNQFSPERIFYKPPILSRYEGDIAILNNKKELLLIELEKPETRLLIKNGGIAAPMQHALDQVRDWLHLTDRHRSAVIEGIGLEPNEVTSVKGIVILGRDRNCNAKHLRKLKWTGFDRTTFFTYDDVLKSLTSLIRTMAPL